MNKDELKNRTKKFAVEVVKMVNEFPKTTVGFVLGSQILKSGTSVGANYRAALRGKSQNDFSYKIKVVEEEADETLFWIEVLEESEIIKNKRIPGLKTEAGELTAIFSSISKTLKEKQISNRKS